MSDEEIHVTLHKPEDLSKPELEQFLQMIIDGGQVADAGLRDRVLRASMLARLYDNRRILAIGALKVPYDTYRDSVSKGAGVSLDSSRYPWELGWVFVHPNGRGRGLSSRVCAHLMEYANGDGVFATLRVINTPMHRALCGAGFVQSGSEWVSSENGDKLMLFLANA